MTEPILFQGPASAGVVASGRRWGVGPRLVRMPGFWIGLAILTVFVVMAVVPAVVVGPSPASADPRDCALRDDAGGFQDRLRPSREHWLGTDVRGCDYYAQLVYGARASIATGLLATALASSIGLVLGALAGLKGGWVDRVIGGAVDVVLGFPFFVGAITLLALGGDGRRTVPQVALAIGALAWPAHVRVVRTSVLQAKQLTYVDAARSIGASELRVLVVHILPNAVTPLVVVAALTVAGVIGAEAALSYLGVGVQFPTISWGLMVQSAQPLLRDAPHLMVFPAACISLAVLGCLLLGDALQDALEDS